MSDTSGSRATRLCARCGRRRQHNYKTKNPGEMCRDCYAVEPHWPNVTVTADEDDDALCGSESGYKRHRRRGQVPCDACVVAHSSGNARREGRPALSTRRSVAQCGTDTGYTRHLRVTKTKPCEPCREAHNDAERRRQARKKAA